MTDYRPVTEALASGADPAMLCMICPWDRNCLNPPSISPAEVEQKLRDAQAAASSPAQSARNASGAFTSAILQTLFFAGRDTSIQACPVLCARLKSSSGRQLADTIRAAMQSWDDGK